MRDVEFHFEDKNFVVVGASFGMGRQIALNLAKSGTHVLAVARNEDRLLEVQGQFPDRIAIQFTCILWRHKRRKRHRSCRTTSKI